MKKYVLGFDFYDRHINKFHFCFIDVDLNKERLIDVARQIIKDDYHDVDHINVTIKITLFNNIEL